MSNMSVMVVSCRTVRSTTYFPRFDNGCCHSGCHCAVCGLEPLSTDRTLLTCCDACLGSALLRTLPLLVSSLIYQTVTTCPQAPQAVGYVAFEPARRIPT